MKVTTRLPMIAAVLLTVTACDQLGLETAIAEPTGSATSIRDVHSVFVTANDCEAGIRKGLGERGFGAVSSVADADAVLTVTLTNEGRNLEQLPEFGGFGARASYSARLTGAQAKSLFATSGEEGSITRKEMCEDIGDEIAQRLKAARGR